MHKMNNKGQVEYIFIAIIAIIMLCMVLVIDFSHGKIFSDRERMEEIITIDLVCHDSEDAYTYCMDVVDLNPGCQNYVYDLKKACNNFKVSIEE